MSQRRDLLQESLAAIERLQAKVKEYERADSEPIAIVGAGCRYPGGVADLESLWRLLRDGVDAIAEVRGDRWNLADYYDPDPQAVGKATTKWGGFLRDIDRFDAQFFGISPREAASLDPQQRLLLEVSQEALERAGIPADSLGGSATGVFVGITTSDYASRIGVGSGAAADIYAATGTALNAAAGRIAFNFGLQGPCIAVDTACSSSLSAIHLACQSLRSRECDLALAGGANVILLPELVVLMSKWGTMAADGRCKTFDAAADGFVRSEGCAIVALKRLSDALNDGSPILAVIRGSAINSDGRSSGLTVPNGLAQQSLLRRALKNAGLSGADVDYIEAHGTGTALGDPIEIEALAAVLCDGRSAAQPLRVGSIKTNLGHAESAAGIAGVLKAALALQHEAIPRHLHFTNPSPAIDWTSGAIEVPTRLVAWPRGARVRRAGVSSFGFSGTNAHVVLEEAPAAALSSTSPSDGQPIVGSARTEPAARELALRYAQHLREHPECALADLSRTTTAGRAAYPYRFGFAADSIDEALRNLERIASGHSGGASGAPVSRTSSAGRARVAFMFPGQGAQYAGMALELSRKEPVVRRALDECEQVLSDVLDIRLMELLGRADLLDQTLYTQPALFAVEWALSQFWRSVGIEPSAVIGHSVGEYVAACVADVMDLLDGARLIAARARLMQEKALPGAMLAVLADQATIEEALAPYAGALVIAAYNAPDSLVVSGPEGPVAALQRDLELRSIRAQRLAVSRAFHSPLLDPMLSDFAAIAATVRFRAPSLPIYSNLSGSIAGAEIATARYWVRHAREPVRFAAGIAELMRSGVQILLEVGAGSTLSSLARRAHEGSSCDYAASLRKDVREEYAIAQAAAQLWKSGAPIDWPRFQNARGGRLISVPTYPFQRERFWLEAAPRAAAVRQSSSSQSGADAVPTDWFYEVQWRASPPVIADASRQSWLIISDRSGFGEALAAGLHRGSRCVVDSNLHAVAAHLEQGVTHIVHCASLDVSDVQHSDGASLLEAQRRSCGSVLELIQVAARFGSTQPPRISIVTRGAVTVGEGQTSRVIAAAPMAGLVRTIALEHPQFLCRMIDLDPESAAQSALCETLQLELSAPDGEAIVALRESAAGAVNRYVPRLVRANVSRNAAIPLAASATYLITGGLGGLGLRMARALVEAGARHLVLTGRGAPSAEASLEIERLRADGAQVRIEAADAADERSMRALFESIAQGTAPLGGLVHAAGVLDDGVLVQQTWPRFERVLKPKVQGAWNLHALSAGLPLQFFVLFASVSGVLGSPAQGNYAAANAFLDALAQERRARGLAAASIAWGAWAASGMADNRDTARRARQQGISLMDPAAATRAFLALLQTDAPCTTVVDVDWSRFAANARASSLSSMLQDLAGPAQASVAAIEPLPARLSGLTSDADRVHATTRFVCECIAAVLGLRADDVAPDESLVRLGLDSLMALEVRNRIESGGAGPVSLARLLDGSDARAVADAILEAGRRSPPADVALDEEAILEQIATMSEEEIEAQLALLQKEAES